MRKKEKSRRLTLSRETILIFNAPALLEHARGGLVKDVDLEHTTTHGGICETVGSIIGIG